MFKLIIPNVIGLYSFPFLWQQLFNSAAASDCNFRSFLLMGKKRVLVLCLVKIRVSGCVERVCVRNVFLAEANSLVLPLQPCLLYNIHSLALCEFSHLFSAAIFDRAEAPICWDC